MPFQIFKFCASRYVAAESTKLGPPQRQSQQSQSEVGWMTQTNALFTDEGDERVTRAAAAAAAAATPASSPSPAPAAVAPAAVAPAPAASDGNNNNSASLERQMALLRAELAMTRSDLESAQREAESQRLGRRQAESEAESLRAVLTSQAGQLKLKEGEVESLRRGGVYLPCLRTHHVYFASLDLKKISEALDRGRNARVFYWLVV